MPAAVVLSLAAERDLDGLFEWIAKDSGVERAAAVLSRIDDTLTNLAFAPLIGRVRGDLEGAPRVFAIWPWLVFYEPARGGGIFVLRVVDGRRDLSRGV